MIEKVQNYIQRFHMIEPNDTIVAGVSGGADSVCLLHVLKEMQRDTHLLVHVVHINHHMREEAGEDAAFVRRLCKDWGIPFYLVEEDVEAVAKELHLSPEEAGRKVRYEAFEKVFQAVGADKIAVAHNKNDCAETVVFNLFRGSSMRGMNGIAPVRGHIIRPLLGVERSEIEAYLQEKNIPYCIDRTNWEDTYTRNRIRHHILPYAEEQISQNVVRHIADTAELFGEAEELLQKLSHQAYHDCVAEHCSQAITGREGLEMSLAAESVLGLDRIVQKYLTMECLSKLAGSRKDITSKHVADVLALFTKQVGRKTDLPYGMAAKREYGSVRIFLSNQQNKGESTAVVEKADIRIAIQPDMEMEISGLGRVRTRIIDRAVCSGADPWFVKGHESEIIQEKTYTKWFDYDKIVRSLVLRTRKAGDYLTINEDNNKKSLKEYMINEKIPQADRDKLFVAADGNHILWLIGYRISQYYKVNRDTRRILEVHIY